MQTLFVTGATGQLGGLVIDTLLETLPADAIIAGVRDDTSEAAARLRARGVALRIADYGRPETLSAALRGVDRLLLVSGNEIGQRVAQHGNVIDAARNSGVGLIAYTSILHADRSPLMLAREHRQTEALLAGSGVPHVLLRNGWYTEVYTWRLPAALEQGVLYGASGNGRISSAARADYARAAATVLAGGDHAGRVYELAGDASFTLAELAGVAGRAAGRPLAYGEVSPEALREASERAGVPPVFAEILADTDAGVADGALFDEGHALSKLIGRPTTPFADTITRFVKATAAADQA